MSNLPMLQVTIDNKEGVELFDFVTTMTALNDEYIRFAIQNKKSVNDSKLYVNKMSGSHGSVFVELVENSDEPILSEFSRFFVDRLNYLCGRRHSLPNNCRCERKGFIKSGFSMLKDWLKGSGMTALIWCFGVLLVLNLVLNIRSK